MRHYFAAHSENAAPGKTEWSSYWDRSDVIGDALTAFPKVRSTFASIFLINIASPAWTTSPTTFESRSVEDRRIGALFGSQYICIDTEAWSKRSSSCHGSASTSPECRSNLIAPDSAVTQSTLHHNKPLSLKMTKRNARYAKRISTV